MGLSEIVNFTILSQHINILLNLYVLSRSQITRSVYIAIVIMHDINVPLKQKVWSTDKTEKP